MNETRSLGIQCQSRKSTAIQTKRLSKEELRYYTKIVEKEKQVLLNFMKATKDFPQIKQPYYRVNMAPTQTKVRKSSSTRKKRKSKNGKHSSNKKKYVSANEANGDEENSGHYVSKIVVDDATHCLKLRVRSCNPKKSSRSQDLKEMKNTAAPQRARSRKAKQPRRYINKTLESESAIQENNDGILQDVNNKSCYSKVEPMTPCDGPLSPQYDKEREKEVLETERSMDSDEIHGSSKGPAVKAEEEHTDCLLANKKSRECHSSPDSSPLPSRTPKLAPILPPTPSDEDSRNRQETSDDEYNYHSPNDDSDDNQSVCSEEFVIVEAHEQSLNDEKVSSETSSGNGDMKTEPEKRNPLESKMESNIEETQDTNLKDELKKRLKANLIRRAVDSEEYENDDESNKDRNKMAENKARTLPQVVSVHFYDPQTHSQQMVAPETRIPRYPTYPITRGPRPPPTTLPYPRVPSLSSHQPSRPLAMPQNPRQVPLPRIPPMTYPYPQYYRDATHIHEQRLPYETPGIPLNATTKERTLPPVLSSNSSTSRGITSPNASIPMHVRSYHHHHHHHHPGILTNDVTSRGDINNASVSTGMRPHHPQTLISTDMRSQHQEFVTNPTTSRGSELPSVNTSTTSHPIETEEDPEITTIDLRERKRKRFIFGSHEPPKKKVISSLLTPLCEREATRLADGIHEINMQYFPLRSLAQKAAKRVSGDTDDVLKLIEQKIQLKTKIQDVEKARNLLKDIYDMVLKSKEIEDIQNFELVSHNFGVRNILNHLSLVDLYFGELGSELESKI